MKLDVDYELTGCVNNTQIEVKGKGQADFDTGRYEMSLQLPTIPMHWDPAYIILICCDRMLGVSAREAGGAKNIYSISGGDYTIQDRSGEGFTIDGRKIAHASASSLGYITGNKIVSRSQLLECWVRLNLLEEITKIHQPYYGTMVPFGDDGILVTSSYSFETNQGNTYRGFTNYPYKSGTKQTIAGPQLLSIADLKFSKTSPRGGQTQFDFEMTSVVNALVTA